MSISAVLAAVVVAAVAFSLLVLDKTPSSVALDAENDGSGSDSSWLVLTWGPSLCKVEPTNRGCVSGHVGSMGRNWVLHGLWPQPAANQYCGVPADTADRARDFRSDGLPAPLSQGVRAELEAQLSDAEVMAPHEWYAHGTCSGVTPDVYFGDAADLADQIREVLTPMFDAAQGGRLSLTEVRERFDAAFGAGAGERVRLTCRNVTGQGSVLYEAQVSLPPVVELRSDGQTSALPALLAAAPEVEPGCRHGSVP
jgi:ribonuclease T2